MIVSLNLIFIIVFFIKGFLDKNKFNISKQIKFFILECKHLILKRSNLVLSFKSLSKLYNSWVFKLRLKKKLPINFKHLVYNLWLLNKLNLSLDFTCLLFNEKTKDSFKKNEFNFVESKLNYFLNKTNNPIRNYYVNSSSSILSTYFKPSSFVKFLSDKSYVSVLFLRKNKIFNKGRYSRNRQLYRTGVYWCIWLSVFLGYCLYFSFYRFTFNFGYQWWLIFGFLFLFINQKMLKYNFYNIRVVSSELKKNFNWVALLSYSFFKKWFALM